MSTETNATSAKTAATAGDIPDLTIATIEDRSLYNEDGVEFPASLLYGRIGEEKIFTILIDRMTQEKYLTTAIDGMTSYHIVDQWSKKRNEYRFPKYGCGLSVDYRKSKEGELVGETILYLRRLKQVDATGNV